MANNTKSWNLFKLFKYAVLAVLLIAIFWLVIGFVSLAYEFRDRDSERGAITLDDDLFGDNFTEVHYLPQGWSKSDSLWFYYTTQGSNLLPYDFFLELEQADSTALFRDNQNMNRFRYLPQKPTAKNKDGLPVGMTRDRYQGTDYFGFTCAACHTSQLNYKGNGIRIDGGPAASDLESFMNELAASLDRTLKDNAKQKRFIKAVIERGDYDDAEEVLADLKKYAYRITAYNIINDPSKFSETGAHYGYARLDAFGRIFNRVLEHLISVEELQALLVETVDAGQLKKVMDGVKPVLASEDREHLLYRIGEHLSDEQIAALRDKLFNPADAPVSYPFLWDIPQHDYVQWNGVVGNSGIGPMGRNAGQVIGVFGTLDWQRKDGISISSVLAGQGLFSDSHIDFSSSIDIRNLRRVESHLKTLTSPKWPEDLLTSLDQDKLNRGRGIFNQYCAACHERIDPVDENRRVIAFMSHIDSIKTDPTMAKNSTSSVGYSGILRHEYVDVGEGNLLLERKAPVAALLKQSTRNTILTPDPDKLFIQRWAERLFDLLLSATENSIEPSIKRGDYEPNTTVSPFESLNAYKGRSLNGIWATAPYLHNGSIPSLYDLLLPKKRPEDPEDGEYRPDTFMVGSREFDPVNVGFVDEGYLGFEFDTSLKGNSNSGHEYAAGRTPLPDGTLLPALDANQRGDLLEYLKSL